MGKSRWLAHMEDKKDMVYMSNLPELMTVKELREYLKCSNAKAYSLVRSKGFPSFKIGNSFRIRRSEFIEWVQNQKV